MSTYEIFDLLFTEIKDKFEHKNCVFTQKYVVAIHEIKLIGSKNLKIDVGKAFKILNNLQEKFAYQELWSKHLKQETVFVCLNSRA